MHESIAVAFFGVRAGTHCVGANAKAFVVCAPHNESFIADFAPAYRLRSCRAGTHFLVEEESVQRLIGAPFRWVPQAPPQTTKGRSLWIPLFFYAEGTA